MNELLTTEEAAKYLRKSPNTLRQWRHEGKGPDYIPGRPALYRKSALDEYLERITVIPAEKREELVKA